MRLFRDLSRRSRRAMLCIPIVATLSLAACNAADTSSVDISKFTLTTTRSADSVAASTGTPATILVNIVRGGGYLDGAALTIDTVPTGVTATFTPTTVSPGFTTSILTLSVGTSAVIGTTSMRIITSGVAVKADTSTIKLTVVAPAIAMSAATTLASAPVGGSASIPLTFDRLNGYAGSITLVAEGVPNNVTATFTPALITNGVTSSTLTLAPVAGAAAGTSTITIRAKGSSGVPDQTAPLQFTIAGGAAADYSLSASTAALTLAVGGTTQTTINFNRTGGFAGAVSLSLAGLPAGVSGTFTPATANTTGSSVLALSATTAAVPGRYPMTLTATAVGGATRTLPLVLTVAPQAAVQVTATPVTLTIAKLVSGQSTIAINRVGGVVGDITMTVDGLPTGVTALYTPSTIAGGLQNTLLTLTVGASATPGTYSVVVRATSTGGIVGTATVSLVVTN